MLTYIEAYEKIMAAVKASGTNQIVEVQQRRTSYCKKPDFNVVCVQNRGVWFGINFVESGEDIDVLVDKCIALLAKCAEGAS
jgi:hypothetical protein